MAPVNRSDCVETPALLTTTFTSDATSAARRTDSGSVMSSCTGIAPGISTVSGRRAAAYTLAPRATNSVAKRLPSPRFAPVTSAMIWLFFGLIVVISMSFRLFVLYQTVNNATATLFPIAAQPRLQRVRIRDGDGERGVVPEADDALDLLAEVDAQPAARVRPERQTVVGERDPGTDRRPPSVGTGDVGVGDVRRPVCRPEAGRRSR